MADFDPYLTWHGIPPTQRPPTYYQLLGVDPAITDPAVIKALAIQRTAYVRNFQKGDQGETCTRILEEIAHAEVVLTDAVQRAAYEKTLKPTAPPLAAVPTPVVARAVPARPKSAPSKHSRPSAPNDRAAVKPSTRSSGSPQRALS